MIDADDIDARIGRSHPVKEYLARSHLLRFVALAALVLLAAVSPRNGSVHAQSGPVSLPGCSVSQYTDRLVTSPDYAVDRTLFWLTRWYRQLGVLRSSDDGETWLQVYGYSYGTGSAGFSSFETAPGRTTPDVTAYLGVDHGDYPTASACIFQRSNDAGNTWEDGTAPCSEQLDCPRFSLRATNRPGWLFQPRRWFFGAGLPEGVVRSEDGGATWRQVWSETPVNAVAVSPDFDQDETVFASLAGSSSTLNASFIISHDAGETWSGGGEGLCFDYIPELLVSPGFARDHTLLASADGSSLYMSQDDGLTWRGIFPPGGPYCSGSGYGSIYPQFSPDYPDDPTLYAASSQGLYASYDAGRSWTLLVLNASKNLLVRRTPDMLEPSRDELSAWLLMSASGAMNRVYLPLATVHGVGPPDRQHTLFMKARLPGTYNDAQYRSSDGGKTWQCMEVPRERRRAYLPLLRVRT